MSHTALLRVFCILVFACVFIRLSSAKHPVHRRSWLSWWVALNSSLSSSSSYQDDDCVQRCYNGGVCYDTNKCSCTPQYTGDTCETAICNPACSTHGHCVLPNVCQCSTGYEAKLCDTAICKPRCQNGGKCSNPGECTCGHQYSGGACEHVVCQHNCLNGGKCTSPDVCTCAVGYTGTVCESAVCTKSCLNGGSCIAPDICACAPGHLGTVCELGGDPSSFLIPSHHFANERTGQPLSWYEEEPLSIFGKNCLVKVEILNADVETLLTATSYTSTGDFLGNYTVGGADTGMRSNGSHRAACLEIRCPSDLHEDSVVVNITIATSRQKCHVVDVWYLWRFRNFFDIANITGTLAIFPCYQYNSSSLVHGPAGYDSYGNEDVTFQLQPYRDYGSMYGVYITYGIRQRMQYAGEKMCRSGTNMGDDTVVPRDGTIVVYVCT